MRKKIMIGVGEILWDLLPEGKQLGGAPANFTYHAHALGAEAYLISRIGKDLPGEEILRRLQPRGFSLDTISLDPNAPTGTVSVKIDPDGQPHYIIHENVAWDYLSPSEGVSDLACRADAVCFGSLAQRTETSRYAIRRILSSTPDSALRIFDVNIRRQYYSTEILEWSLQAANVLKWNETELPLLTDRLGIRGNDQERVAEMARRYQLRMVAYTRGLRGSLLYLDGQWSDHPGIPVPIVDTIGAGDAFTAAMSLGLLSAWPLGEINRKANEVASFVCTQSGGMPELPETLRQSFAPLRSVAASEN